jgi:hypothetical protein
MYFRVWSRVLISYSLRILYTVGPDILLGVGECGELDVTLLRLYLKEVVGKSLTRVYR